jgi:hypothetical protein
MGPDETIGFYVPKGHQFEHMLAFFWIFAPGDAARLNNFEFEHIKHVKDAPKRTRGHEGTMLEELKAVVDRIDAVKTQLARSRVRAAPPGPLCTGFTNRLYLYTTLPWLYPY